MEVGRRDPVARVVDSFGGSSVRNGRSAACSGHEQSRQPYRPGVGLILGAAVLLAARLHDTDGAGILFHLLLAPSGSFSSHRFWRLRSTGRLRPESKPRCGLW
jgi:hypothetical protein